MPIILQNSFSHEFVFTAEDGTVRTARLKQGDALPEGIPAKKLTELISQMVVKGDSTVPRYRHVDEVPGVTYTAGTVTTQKQAEQLNELPTQTDLEAAMERAAEALAAESAAAVGDDDHDDDDHDDVTEPEAEPDVAPGHVGEAPAVDPEAAEREELIATLAEAGVKVHPATGIVKLREKVQELTTE